MKILSRIWDIILIFYLANAPTLVPMWGHGIFVAVAVLLFLVINVAPCPSNRKLLSRRLKICGNGCELLIVFIISAVIIIVYSIAGFFGAFPVGSIAENLKLWLINTLVAILVEAIVFWNGIIRVYMTSQQLGLRWRVVGIICGMIPIAHLVALGIIIKTVSFEVSFENEKLELNRRREAERICATKYPILMVHGVFFRDYRFLNYWGRIPKELEKNGAVVYYGNHQSAESVEECAKEIAARIEEIVRTTGCEKVNIIAHSKGGLDSRYAISLLGASQYVASLTTINTPHRGCEFADYLLSKMAESQKNMLAKTYNAALKKLGDTSPDFLAAVSDLTASACRERNELVKDVPEVYYQSVGSILNHASSGRFPLNFSYELVNYFDGSNDGLVGEKSFPWGEKFQMVQVKGKRGVSHGDMIDLNRENIRDFDVREFFVQLVSNLREMGF